MTQEEIDELIKETVITDVDKHIGEDLVFLNIEHGINFNLKNNDLYKPYYEVDINDICKSDITIEEMYTLLNHGWKKKINKLINFVE